MKWFPQLKYVLLFAVVSGVVFFAAAGCQKAELLKLTAEVNKVTDDIHTVTVAVDKTTYGPDETLNLLRALQSGNAASVPFNPYALPIGAGLSGIIAVLEALRRKERGGRKYAEYKLTNGSATNGNTGN